MSAQCNFILDRPYAAYYSGELISGTIVLNTAKDKTVNDVRIVFLGEGKVIWDESDSTTNSDGSTSTSTTCYTSHIVYINNETQVHGSGVLSKGQYTFNFNIQLPSECPTSCEGIYGQIRYVISLVVNRPYRFNDVFKKPISVIQTVDLNTNPVFRIGVVAEEIGYTSCCSCSTGKLLYTLRIPFGAYAPGQWVQYSLRIDNQSNTDTCGYFLVFSQKQIFIAHSPYRKEISPKTKLVQQEFPDSCLRLSARVFRGKFRIPSVAACTVDPNAIIKFEYKLKVTVRMPGCNSNTHIKIPVSIGTIPLRESLLEDTDGMARISETVATAHDREYTNIHLPQNDKDINPPTFEEAVGCESHSVQPKAGEHKPVVAFRPLYPMYWQCTPKLEPEK